MTLADPETQVFRLYSALTAGRYRSLHSVESFLKKFEIGSVADFFAGVDSLLPQLTRSGDVHLAPLPAGSIVDPLFFQRVFGRTIALVEDTGNNSITKSVAYGNLRGRR
jgi:hypothetical protein